MSFLTCLWDLPQKLQRSCSFPSLALATSTPCNSNSSFRLAPIGAERSCRPRPSLVLDLLWRRRVGAVRQYAVDQSVLERLFRGHEVVALHVLGDLLHLLTGVRREDLLEPALDVDYFARLNLDVGSLALEAARNLMDEDLRVGQRGALALGAPGQEYRAHRHGDADTGRLHVGLDELHRVVNGQSGVHGAPGRVDVDGNVLVRVFGLQVDQLSDDQVGDLIIDRRAQEDDPLVEKPVSYTHLRA